MENKIYKMRYSSIDGYRLNKSYKTKKGAIAFINKWVGAQELIGSYIMSNDGIGKVTALNFRFSDLTELEICEDCGAKGVGNPCNSCEDKMISEMEEACNIGGEDSCPSGMEDDYNAGF